MPTKQESFYLAKLEWLGPILVRGLRLMPAVEGMEREFSFSQTLILMMLLTQQSVKMKELARLLGLSRANATGLVDRLEARDDSQPGGMRVLGIQDNSKAGADQNGRPVIRDSAERYILVSVIRFGHHHALRGRPPDHLFAYCHELDIDIGAVILEFRLSRLYRLIPLNDRKDPLSVDLDTTVCEPADSRLAQEFQGFYKAVRRRKLTLYMFKGSCYHSTCMMALIVTQRTGNKNRKFLQGCMNGKVRGGDPDYS